MIRLIKEKAPLAKGQLWDPWIGKKFKKQNKKILLVGESHSATKDNGEFDIKIYTRFLKQRNTTIKLIRRVLRGDTWATFDYTYRLLTGKTSIDRINIHDFWHRVAFYNLIQRPLTDVSDELDGDDYKDNMFIFLDVLSNMKDIPDEIIFLGNSSREYLVEAVNENPNMECSGEGESKDKIDGNSFGAKYKIKLKDQNHTINVCFVRSPSSFFSYPVWHEYLVKGNRRLEKYLKKIFAEVHADKQI